MAMRHDVDPATEIFNQIGDLSRVEVMFGRVLVAVYMRPKTTASGIHLPDQTRDEDEYQGKAALVLKLGKMAFVDTKDVEFHGESVEVGDWIAMRPSDGQPITINKVKCRIVQDVHCVVKIPAPDMVW